MVPVHCMSRSQVLKIDFLTKKKSSCQKRLDRFPYNFAEMFLWWPSTKIVQAIWIRQKTWPPGGGAYFLYIIYIENFKNLLVRNHWTDFNIILQKCSFGDPLPRLFKPFGFVRKHGRQGAGLIFPIYLYRKLKKSSCQKDRLLYTFAEMFLWWSSTKIGQAIWICQKTWPPGGGAYFPYIENLKKTSCHKPLDRLPYNFAEMVLWWPSTKIVQAIWICQKTWPPGGEAHFPYIIYLENLKKSSCQKPLDQLLYNFAEIFLWWSSTKFVQAIRICQKTWPPGGGAYFPYISL